MLRWFPRIILVSTLALLLGGPAAADPVQWTGNGHYYQLVPAVVSWHEAEAMAEAMTFLDRQGHLVTLTSQAENDFVFWEVVGGNIDTPHGDPWLGAYQNSFQSPPDENWHWVTNEDWDFTNWDDGEPNDYDEQYAELFLNFQLWGDGTWNDHHGLIPKAFVVEFSGDVVATEARSLSDVKALFQ